MKIRICLCVLLALFLFSFPILAAETDIAVCVTAPNGETVRILPENDVFYLPSAADIRALFLDGAEEISYRMGDTSGTLRKGETLDITPAKTVDSKGCVCYILTLSVKGKEMRLTFYHDPFLPCVFIATEKGISYLDQSKDHRDKNAQILMMDADGSLVYAENETKSEIKGRGNATFTYLKKPYQIKLGEKTALFGMDKAKTWILLANYTDQSAVHNAMAFTFGEALQIPYNIDYRFVNLYIDGAYRGLYMLTEKVQVDKNRVDIVDLEKENEEANDGKAGDEFPIVKQTSGDVIEHSILSYYTYAEGMQSPKDITGGYLVELDINRGLSEPCHFVTENGSVYTVKAPEYASREEMEYIASLFADLEEAVFSADGYNRKGIHYSEYIDMESFAGVYTIQELMKNWDAYLSSMFFFKDADKDGARTKIYMGPLWDMDNTLGNIDFNYEFGRDTAYLWAQDGVFQDLPRNYAKKLMTHEDFQKAVENAYDAAYLAAEWMLADGGWLDMTVATIHPSVMMDRTRWMLYDAKSWLLNQSGYKSNVKFVQFKEYGTPQDETKDTALGFLRYYLTARMDALLDLIGSGEVPTLPPPPETTETEISLTEMTKETTVFSEQTADTVVQTEDTSVSEKPMDCGRIDLFVGVFIAVSVLIVSAILVILISIFKNKKR